MPGTGDAKLSKEEHHATRNADLGTTGLLGRHSVLRVLAGQTDRAVLNSAARSRHEAEAFPIGPQRWVKKSNKKSL